MKTVTKTAAQLQSGDKIVSEGTFPQSMYTGVVAYRVIEDDKVRIELKGGGCYSRPLDHRFTVEA